LLEAPTKHGPCRCFGFRVEGVGERERESAWGFGIWDLGFGFEALA